MRPACLQNTSTATNAFSFHTIGQCGAAPGCLFELISDPSEYHDVGRSAAHAELAASLLAKLRAHNTTTFSPNRGPGEASGNITAACDAAHKTWGGFWGPFL